jgi:hypothetical protein
LYPSSVCAERFCLYNEATENDGRARVESNGQAGERCRRKTALVLPEGLRLGHRHLRCADCQYSVAELELWDEDLPHSYRIQRSAVRHAHGVLVEGKGPRIVHQFPAQRSMRDDAVVPILRTMARYALVVSPERVYAGCKARNRCATPSSE